MAGSKVAHLAALMASCVLIGNSQSFSLASSSNSLSVTQGGNVTATITVTPSGGFTAAVTPTVTGLPAGATATFSPATLNSPYTGGTTLTITTSGSTAVGMYPFTVGTSTTPPPIAPLAVALTVGSAPGSGSASDTLKNDFGFGVALGLSTNVTGADIVNNATIDANGIVRVNTRANTAAGFMLETHYYIWPRPTAAMLDGTSPDTRSWGVGPFVAAQPGSAQIISAVGAGAMIGFRRPKGTTPSGFGLGLGYEAIPAAQVLGNEFVNGQPAPVGPNGQPLSIRYETEDKGALLIVLSVAF